MDWKTINKADSVAYIALAILGYAIPNISYRVFLLDFSAELSKKQDSVLAKERYMQRYFKEVESKVTLLESQRATQSNELKDLRES